MNLQTIVLTAAIENPFENVTPNFAVFGAEATELWQRLLGAAWVVGLLVAAAFLIVGLVKMGKSSDDNPHQYKQGRKSALMAGGSFGGLVALPLIAGAIITVFS